MSEHVFVVVTLQEKRVASVEEMSKPFGDMAEVGDQGDAAGRAFEAQSDLMRVVRDCTSVYRDVADAKGAPDRKRFGGRTLPKPKPLHRVLGRAYRTVQPRRVGRRMGRVVGMAMGDEDGRYIDRRCSAQRLKALDESAVRQTGVDEKPRFSGV